MQKAPPYLTAASGFAAACLAAAALGVQWTALSQQKIKSSAARMVANAATAQAIHGGAMRVDNGMGAVGPDGRDRWHALAKAHAAAAGDAANMWVLPEARPCFALFASRRE